MESKRTVLKSNVGILGTDRTNIFTEVGEKGHNDDDDDSETTHLLLRSTFNSNMIKAK